MGGTYVPALRGRSFGMSDGSESTPNARIWPWFGVVLGIVAVGWLVVAVAASARHRTSWVPFGFAVAFGIASVYVSRQRSREASQGVRAPASDGRERNARRNH